MKLLVTGFSNLGLDCFDGLEEPNPYKLSRAILERSIIVEDSNELRSNLKFLWDSCKFNTNSSMRTFIEMVLSTPRSHKNVVTIDVRLAGEKGPGFYEKILGEQVNRAYANLIRPNLKGTSREDLFNSKLLPFVKSANKVTLYDRYLCNQLLSEKSDVSGAHWLINKLVQSGIEHLVLISGSQLQEFRITKEDLNSILMSDLLDLDKIRVDIHAGYVNHDRHIRFSYPASNKEICLTMGKGAEIFQHEVLRENFAIAQIDETLAISNEMSIRDRVCLSSKNY